MTEPSAQVSRRDELTDAVTLLRLIVGPCEGADEHSWRKCKRCAAIHGVEERFSLSMKLLKAAADALSAGSDAPPLKGIEGFIDEISDLNERSPLTPHGRNCVRTILLAFSAHVKRQVEQADAPPRWQPIESVPERRKVFVTWVNALGNRRTALASFWPAGTLDMADNVDSENVNEDGHNAHDGWWEESEGNDDAMFPLDEAFTHWMPLPPAPAVPRPRDSR